MKFGCLKINPYIDENLIKMILTIITIIAVGWFMLEFEPLQIAVDGLRTKVKNNLLLYLLGMFNCWQCLTFWTGLALTYDFKIACMASMGSLIIETWIKKNS